MEAECSVRLSIGKVCFPSFPGDDLLIGLPTSARHSQRGEVYSTISMRIATGLHAHNISGDCFTPMGSCGCWTFSWGACSEIPSSSPKPPFSLHTLDLVFILERQIARSHR
ncbi:UNVERIFIED_CONTAM: hypothetical protein Sindi_2116400 [Sesamum indicum]